MRRELLGELYTKTRAATDALTARLEPEDCLVQSMPDASPIKWHLAHTSWFFETFVLARAIPGYEPPTAAFGILFNSYYHAVGRQHPRPQRGLLSRPTLAEVRAYRARVDDWMRRLIEDAPAARFDAVAFSIELGVNHEEQHQELILTDLKHALCSQPLRPAGFELRPAPRRAAPPLGWLRHPGGLVEIGAGQEGFAFDNERPRHRAWVEPFELADRLVTNREYLEFISDGGYQRVELWLSEGWDARRLNGWEAPLYWDDHELATLGGVRAIDPDEPVCHLSYYEADAFARWAGARLPLESEWELCAASAPVEGNFVESGYFHPVAGSGQLFGDVWEWTASPYAAYPGYRPFDGALGEYNAKFMVNQVVLRGGSCATPARHVRASYRNFFSPAARWQFSGLRLARSEPCG
jgi:ergothioneine biosynthesis protein EgtB